MGSSSLTRDQTWAPCIREHRVLATGPQGSPLVVFFVSRETYMFFKFIPSYTQEMGISLYVNFTLLKICSIRKENYFKICLMTHT